MFFFDANWLLDKSSMSYVFPDGQYFDQQIVFFFDATMEWNECTAKSLLLLPSSQGRPRGSSPRAAPKHLDEADEADEAKIGQDRPREENWETPEVIERRSGGACKQFREFTKCKHEPCPWISQTRKANAQMKALSSYFDFCSWCAHDLLMTTQHSSFETHQTSNDHGSFASAGRSRWPRLAACSTCLGYHRHWKTLKNVKEMHWKELKRIEQT